MRILKSILSIILIICIIRSINGAPSLHLSTFVNEVKVLESTIYNDTMLGKGLLQLKSIAGSGGFTWDDDTSIIGNIARNIRNIGNAIKFYFYTFIFGTGTILVDVLIVNISIITFILTICGFVMPTDYNPNAPPAEDKNESDSKPWWWFILTPLIV